MAGVAHTTVDGAKFGVIDLSNLYLYPDWEQRASATEHAETRRWRAALLILVIGYLFLAGARFLLPDSESRSLLPDLMVRVFIVAAGLALFSHFLRIHTSNRSMWMTQISYGLGAGAMTFLLMLLAAAFAGLPTHFEWLPLPMLLLRVAFAFGLQAPSEELLFRRIIFHHLAHTSRSATWRATAITLLLNLALYLLQVPSGLVPVQQALWLTGAATMIVVNTRMYAGEDRLIAPIMSNAICQLLVL